MLSDMRSIVGEACDDIEVMTRKCDDGIPLVRSACRLGSLSCGVGNPFGGDVGASSVLE